MVLLTDSSTLVGKVIEADSNRIILKRADYSTTVLPWSTIQQIGGLSCKTKAASITFGVANLNYWSTFYLAQEQSVGTALNLRFGTQFNKHWYRFGEITILNMQPFSATKFGYGMVYYFPFDYTERVTAYGGLSLNFFAIDENKTLFATCLIGGAEWWIKEKVRVFGEVHLYGNIFNMNQLGSQQLLVGIKVNREFIQLYQLLNSSHRLK